MKKTNLLILGLVAASMSFYSCSNNSDASNNDTTDQTEETTDSSQTEETTQETEVTSWTKNGITVSIINDNPAYDDAMLELNVPADGDQLPAGEPVEFVYNVKNYELGSQTSDAESKMCANSAKGQHIHLILNNEPYSAHYESQFNKELDEGSYVALSFLSRSYHMSIKQPDAFVVRKFTVGEAEPMEFDETTPHLFYSRPKGEYNGEDTKKLLLDFYLLNCSLSEDGYKVRATINDTEFILTSWMPYAIEGLPKGENRFKLELLDENGSLIESPFNPVERTVTLSDLN